MLLVFIRRIFVGGHCPSLDLLWNSLPLGTEHSEHPQEASKVTSQPRELTGAHSSASSPHAHRAAKEEVSRPFTFPSLSFSILLARTFPH